MQNTLPSRFSGAQHHYNLLNFLQSVAKHYFDNGQAGDLVVDLLKLGVPRLFAVVAEGKEDQAVSREFSHFLQGYISRYSLKHIILEKMGDIMVRKAHTYIYIFSVYRQVNRYSKVEHWGMLNPLFSPSVQSQTSGMSSSS